MGKTNEVIMSKPMGLKQFMESAPASEALTMQQRLARARSLKKNKAKIAIGRKKAARKIADMDTLKKRARKQARNLLLKKITKDIPKGELSFARRQSIEKQLDKKKAVIDKIAKKLLPKVRQAEIQKKKKARSGDK
tara:strand:+ start:576 stop:983 length:408 start_codon:yes stop_codon:yes gene_type:complete